MKELCNHRQSSQITIVAFVPVLLENCPPPAPVVYPAVFSPN